MNEKKTGSFCEITLWWNLYYIQNQVSPHFFYYPAELMMKNGFDVEVLTKLYPERNEIKCEINNGIKVRRFPKRTANFCKGLLRYMLKRNYSLIHLQTVGFFEDNIPWIVSKIKNTPLVFTSHDPDLPGYWDRQDLRAKMFKKALMMRDSEKSVFIAFTEFQANLYRSFGIKNITIIPHGIDPDIFDISYDHNVAEKYGLGNNNILSVGQIDTRKGQHLLIDSMPGILKDHPNTKLLLVGRAFEKYQIEYKRMLERKIEKMGLKKNVAFLDDLSKEELIQLYILSDVFAFPTDAELSPLVLLEAMAAELPVISTDKPYIKEILQNGNAGVLVKREQKEFEAGIINLLDDKNLISRLCRNGKKAVEEKYRLDKVIKQYRELYRSLIER